MKTLKRIGYWLMCNCGVYAHMQLGALAVLLLGFVLGLYIGIQVGLARAHATAEHLGYGEYHYTGAFIWKTK